MSHLAKLTKTQRESLRVVLVNLELIESGIKNDETPDLPLLSRTTEILAQFLVQN
jgi:hypothetical protein